RREIRAAFRGRAAFLQAPAFDSDEARAEAFQAGEILVAGRLVDGALPAELGLKRLDRQAVRLHAAVATAFAHCLIDHDTHRRVGILVPLAASALLRGAGLV